MLIGSQLKNAQIECFSSEGGSSTPYPTSDNVDGRIIYDIYTKQVMVYDGTATAWKTTGYRITLADTDVSASHYITFANTATGNQDILTDGELTYNPNTNTFTATNISSSGTITGATAGTHTGAVVGNADTATEATTVTVSAKNTTDATFYPVFVDGATGTQGIDSDTGLTYNPLTGILTTTRVAADVTGAVAGNADTATEATNVTVSANNSTDETVYPVFVDGATATQGIESDTGLTYNPSTGILTTTKVVADVTGDATSDKIILTPGTAPADTEGSVYYDSTADNLKVYNGSSWTDIAPTFYSAFYQEDGDGVVYDAMTGIYPTINTLKYRTKVHDDGSASDNYDTSTGRYTIPADGYWQISACAQLGEDIPGFWLTLFVSPGGVGSVAHISANSNSNYSTTGDFTEHQCTISGCLKLAADDEVRLSTYINVDTASGDYGLSGVLWNNTFSIHRVAPY